MSEVSKSLIVTFDALNLVKGIKSIGGPDKQVYYIESDVFAPDRRITPLILQPYLLVEDPHEIIPNGDKISELSSAKWYFDEIKSENRITAKEENASIDTPFALGVNNSLHIRKNVEKAIQLFFEAEYLDIRKNKNIHISLTYLLTTTQSSEVKPAPKLKLSKPQSWKYCPLDKITEATIEAEVFADNKGYKSAVEWCKVENNKEIPLSDEPFVLGGQNSNKLVVNPDVMGDTILRARNLPESEYNRLYGINPEWDGRMSEVVENRNLFTDGDFSLKKWNREPDFDEAMGFFYQKETYNWRVFCTQTILSGEYILSGWFKREIGGVNPRVNLADNTNWYIESDNMPIGKWYYHSMIVKLEKPHRGRVYLLTYNKTTFCYFAKLKLERLSKNTAPTPFTPSPKDLHYQNLIVNGLDKIRLTSSVALNRPTSLTKYGLYYFRCKVDELGVLNIRVQDNTYHGLQSDNGFHSDIYVGVDNPQLDRTGYYGSGVISTQICINLTAKFGAGNEPSKEICDEIFADYGYIPAPEDLAPSGIIKGEYQSDIKFTKYFPEINAEILFLTGDSIRPEHKTIKAQAIFTTNKEPINNPSEFFDIEWFIDPIEAGGVPRQIGTGEFMEIAVSELPLKGGRLVPIRLKYNFK